MAKYIDKSAIVAEIRRIKTHEFYLHLKEDESAHRALDMVLESLDTLEAKEDLETFDKRVTEMWGRCAANPNDTIACLHIDSFIEIARHFFELGLAQKGE